MFTRADVYFRFVSYTNVTVLAHIQPHSNIWWTHQTYLMKCLYCYVCFKTFNREHYLKENIVLVNVPLRLKSTKMNLHIRFSQLHIDKKRRENSIEKIVVIELILILSTYFTRVLFLIRNEIRLYYLWYFSFVLYYTYL